MALRYRQARRVKLPRNLDGKALVRALYKLDYQAVHQTGSHLICRTQRNGQHTEPIPLHSPLKVGTLHSILKRVAIHEGVDLPELLRLLDL